MKIKIVGAFPTEVEWKAIVLPFLLGEEAGQFVLLPFSDEERSHFDIVVMVRFKERLILTELIRGYEGEITDLMKELVDDPFQVLSRLRVVLRAHLTPAERLN